jgi:hypothetical protein
MSASRLSNAYSTWLPRLAPWDLYVTLTYDPNRLEVHDVAPSHWASGRHVASWHRQAADTLGRPTYLAAALEHHRNGWPHWHGLLAAGSVTSADFAELSRLWFSRRGFAHFARIQAGTTAAVAEYCAKYLAKGGGAMALLGPWQTRQAVLQGRLDGRRR